MKTEYLRLELEDGTEAALEVNYTLSLERHDREREPNERRANELSIDIQRVSLFTYLEVMGLVIPEHTELKLVPKLEERVIEKIAENFYQGVL